MKRPYLLLLAILPIVLALMLLIPFIKADTPPPQPAPPSAMAELIETLKIWKLVDAVSPTPEQQAPLLSGFNKLEKLKVQYRQEHRGAMSRLKQLQAATADAEARRAELQAALAHYRQVEDEFIARRKQTMEEINQILTVEQQAQFVVFSYSYRQELKKTLQTLIALQGKGKVKDLLVDKSSAK